MPTSGNIISRGVRRSASSEQTESTGRTSSVRATWLSSIAGFGHYIRQIGNEETQIFVAFNSPDYQEISISSWLASNPSRLLAENFGLDMGDVEKLPIAGRMIVGARARRPRLQDYCRATYSNWSRNSSDLRLVCAASAAKRSGSLQIWRLQPHHVIARDAIGFAWTNRLAACGFVRSPDRADRLV